MCELDADVRKELADAEKRLGELMQDYDELVEANRFRCKQLVEKVAAGEALEGELLSAQSMADSRENIQRSAVISYEAEAVGPLRGRARAIQIKESQTEAQRLDNEAAAARERLDGFLTKAGERERGLRTEVHELEEASARLQRKIRKMRAQPV